MSSILDTITGGSILPHIWCKKITLENSDAKNVYKETEFGKEVEKIQGNHMTRVTLDLEIYQEKSSLYSSNWLNDFSVDGSSLIDSLFIQIVPFKDYNNVIKLLPGNSPLVKPTSGNSEGSVYNAAYFYEDNFLPRGPLGDKTQFIHESIPEKVFTAEKANSLGVIKKPPEPLQFSNAGGITLGAGASGIEDAFRKGKIKEEIINGKAYFVLPYQYTHNIYTSVGTEFNSNLGFLFYSFIHFPYWFKSLQMDVDQALFSNYFEELIVEGPVNSEVVFLNGELQQQRQAFFLPDGQPWGGSVHLHGPDNPSPSGYYGDGGFSPDGTFRGWMAGEKHSDLGEQPRVSLQTVPNNLINDFRTRRSPEPIDNALGKMDEDITELNKGITKMEEFLSPFQKEKRKDFTIDDDSEFSKLYLSRDSSGAVSGIFYINTLELLRNNSSLFPILFDDTPPGFANALSAALLENPFDVVAILEKSRLLEIKIYRDRVKEKVINTRYEKYMNDEFYEEPSQLIGTISDGDTFKSVTSKANFSEIKNLYAVDNEGVELYSQYTNRYFVFKDVEMASLNAGSYMYRLEMKFKDGTYEFLYELFQRLSRTKVLLQTYYDMSISSYTDSSTSRTFQYSRSESESEQYSKAVFTRYFKNGSFKNPEFFKFADDYFSDPAKNPSGAKPWKAAPLVLEKFQRVFGIYRDKKENSKFSFGDSSITNLIDPVTGSPDGISYFISFFETAISKIQSLLSATKVNKSGSEVSANSVPNGYTYNNFLDIIVSPSDSTINEEYTFDHPNEIYEATGNNAVFVDYLSVGDAAIAPLYAARVVSNNYLVNRCRLESAKWSPLAKTDQGFAGSGTANNIGIITKASAQNQTDLVFVQNDSLERNAYSFLAPSVVSLRNNITSQEPGYNQVLRCFQPYSLAVSYINSELPLSTLLRQEFFNFAKQDKVYIDMVNYFQDKDVDKNLTFASPKLHLPNVLSDSVNEALSWRNSYKNVLEDLGITFHRKFKHDEVFGRSPTVAQPAGAGTNVVTKNLEEVFPLGPDDYTDGIVFPVDKFKNLLYSSFQNIVRMGYSVPLPEGYKTYNISYPNVFKYPHIINSRNAYQGAGVNPLLHAKIENYISEDIVTISSFLYFQVNLTAKIEVFVGTSGKNAKNDENSWRLLTKQDLQLPDGEVQFCRISLYDKNLCQGMELPILDKYFFVSSNQNVTVEQPIPQPVPNPEVEANENLEFSVGIDFWESKNYLKLAEMNTMLESGLMQGPNMQVMPAGIESQIQNFSALSTTTPVENIGGAANVTTGLSIPGAVTSLPGSVTSTGSPAGAPGQAAVPTGVGSSLGAGQTPGAPSTGTPQGGVSTGGTGIPGGGSGPGYS